MEIDRWNNHIITKTESDLDDVAAFGILDESLENHDRAREGFNGAFAVVTGIREEFAKIDEDVTLGDFAKDTRKRGALKVYSGKIKTLEILHGQMCGEMHGLKARFEPSLPDQPAISAAQWGLLPTDPLDLRIAALDALEKGDLDYYNAALTLPSAFGGSLDADAKTELHDALVLKENPELAAKISRASQAEQAVEGAVRAAADDLRERATKLGPEPEFVNPVAKADPDGTAGFVSV